MVMCHATLPALADNILQLTIAYAVQGQFLNAAEDKVFAPGTFSDNMPTLDGFPQCIELYCMSLTSHCHISDHLDGELQLP